MESFPKRGSSSSLPRCGSWAVTDEFGHRLESFVVLELLKQASWLVGIAGLGHRRTHDNDGVDLVIERDDGAVVAVEVKSRHPCRSDGPALATCGLSSES
ncbi:MAG: DUF4143 domain-containing protein [Actinomycetota bacterium]